MSWDTSNTVLAIPVEVNLGDGTFSPWVIHKPGETAHIHVERIESGPNGDHMMELFGSPDGGTKISTVPLLSYRFKVTDLTKDIIVSGLFSWRIKLIGLGSVKVEGTVNYRLDNVDLR